MTKQQKTEYINQVKERFENARNHGHHGNNWWYPKPFVMAYNVKLCGLGNTIEDYRKAMTKKQNEYYTDNHIIELLDEQQNTEAEMFQDELKTEYSITSGFAGRSGGWLEVEYPNNFNDYEENDLESLYIIAKELEELETTVAERIKKAVSNYKKYRSSKEQIKDFVENGLLQDADVDEIYQNRISELQNKLKA
jgi:hypothetical protein